MCFHFCICEGTFEFKNLREHIFGKVREFCSVLFKGWFRGSDLFKVIIKSRLSWGQVLVLGK